MGLASGCLGGVIHLTMVNDASVTLFRLVQLPSWPRGGGHEGEVTTRPTPSVTALLRAKKPTREWT